jgi:DNA repair photolyase
MKKFNGNAIYNPGEKAAEYAPWACNFYVGCSCGCKYCFNKKGRFQSVLGGDRPTLKKCFKNESHALEVFEKELKQNMAELQEHGLFFSFTTDPMLPNATFGLTNLAVNICIANKIPVKILTRNADTVFRWRHGSPGGDGFIEQLKKYVAFGFTLTGHDELEPHASTNAERIEAMRKLHDAGFITWASIEPVIDFKSSVRMLGEIRGFCDLYKIGLESGKKYHGKEAYNFIGMLLSFALPEEKFYFKDSLLSCAGIDRSKLLHGNCVNRDYNIFKNK